MEDRVARKQWMRGEYNGKSIGQGCRMVERASANGVGNRDVFNQDLQSNCHHSCLHMIREDQFSRKWEACNRIRLWHETCH